ncbi:MAG: MMPL family transporter [Bacteroidetes bacterium]|nr:MMPL family transporter [Bacteroidota bacterium]
MEFIRKHFRLVSWIAMVLVTGITVLSIYELRKTRFDYEFESFFPVDDPDIDVYHDFRKTFGYDNEFVLLALENKKGIFNEDFLERVQTLTDSLRNCKDITSVQSPSDMEYLSGSTGKEPYIHLGEPEKFKTDSENIYKCEELIGSFFATNGKAISIYISTTNGISKEHSDVLLAKMNKLIAAGYFDTVHFASKLNGQKVYLDRLKREFVVFFCASFFLVVLFLFISFRSFWGIWVPILIVIISIIWTLALMTACGKPLDIMTVLLPTMMFVVGMSDVVHIVTKYLEELREVKGISRFDALIKTIKDVGFATFITLITTGLGFLTLLNSHIVPIRDFGLFTSIGVFISFILAFTIMPVVLNVIRHPNLRLEQKSSHFWRKNLHRLLAWIFRKRKMIVIGTVLLTLASVFGVTRIELNNYLIEGLTRHDVLRQDFIYFENNFSGVRPFELVVNPSDPKGNLFGSKELHAIDSLEKWLKKNYYVGFILSPATIIKEANKSFNQGNPLYFKLPDDSVLAGFVADTAKFLRRKEVKLFVTRDLKKGRISGKMHDVGSKIIRAKDAQLNAFMQTPEMNCIQIKHTGAAVMLDKNNVYLVTNMLQGLFFSVFVVGLIIGVIHRSWKMGLIAIIPNFLPIVFIGGLMGFLGIDLKSSTSIIFSIAFGIATDDTVHFLGRLKLERSKGRTVFYALKRTYLSTGKAVVVTSLILSAGFMTLIFSAFESTFFFGTLVSITLLIAVLTDLLLFPLLVVWLVRDKKFKNSKKN